MQVFCTVTARNGERVPIEIADDATAAALRRQVANATKIPLDSLRLIFRGKMIKDDTSKKAIEEYKLESDCVLHCMGKPVEESADHNTTAGRTASDNAVAAASTIRSGTSAAAATASPPLAASRPAAESRPAPGNRSVGAAISRLRQNNPPSVYQTALTTLEKILSKIVGHPMEEKYRKVKRQNPAFQKRLGGLVGGHDCMLAVGFKVELDSGAEAYQLHASPEQWPRLLQAKTEVEQAAAQARQQQSMPAAGNMFATNNNSPLGAGMMPPVGSMPAMDPMMQNQMAQTMSNPEALRAAMQNPMVQEMIRNNPNISPQMRSQFEAITSNPAMMDQIARQMQNPAAMEQMQAMMNARGGAGGFGGGMPGTGAGAGSFGGTAPTPEGTTQINQPPAQGNDQDQTEEEMIAEAIRRSLEDS